MSKRKVHGFINPRNGAETCIRLVDPEERYRWIPYKTKYFRQVTCQWCKRYLRGVR